MEIKELIKTIKKEKDYSLKGLIKIGVFEATLGFKSYNSCLNYVLKDKAMKKDGVLRVRIIGEGKGSRCIMLGKNIINFLKMYEDQNAKQENNQKDC